MKGNEKNVKKKFKKLSAETEPKKNLFKDCINAFIVGGIICDIGQFFNNYF